MKHILTFLFATIISVGAFAQEISGKVVDPNNTPLPGAEITIEGKSDYAITDFDGNFTITAQEGDVLNIKYLGFRSKKITVDANTNFDITLEEDLAQLDEVVVIGYGTQKKSDVTGSVSSVKSEEILKQPAPNALQSVQGKMSGVNIVNTNAPGSAPNVTIRGASSASSGAQVLYIIDGIQGADITQINPADIETMDVLKDAASAAIYGMDAANGVIIITTKKGKQGKMKISLDSYYGAKSMLNPVKMANASQYVQFFNENQLAIGESNMLATNQQYDTDWYDALTDVGFTNSNNVAISGASEKINYFFSFNNYNEDGILENNDYRRNTLRANNSIKLFDDRLTISSNVNVAFSAATPKPFSAFNSAYRQAPIIPTYYPNGTFGQSYWNRTTGIATYEAAPGEIVGRLNSIGNPLAAVYFANERNTGTNLQGTFQAELKITDYLKATSRFAATKNYTRYVGYNDILGQWLADPTQTLQQFEDFKEQNPESTNYAYNSLSRSNSESYRYNWDSFLTFDKVFDQKHNVSALVGFTKGMRNDYYYMGGTAYEVPAQSQYWSLDLSQNSNYDKTVTQYRTTPTTQLSYFGRLQYNYDSKYYFQANFRRDGVSTFKNQSESVSNADYYGNFPSFSAGWAISNEKFFDVEAINFLKVKAGWGKLGNSEVPFNSYTLLTSPGSSNTNYVFGPGQEFIYGAAYGADIVPISWEVTEETNLGLDFAMFDSRLSGNVNYYNRNTKNAILLVRPILNSGNSESYYDHGAEVLNKGFELELNWRNRVTEDFSYNIGGTFSTNKNSVENVKPAYDGQTGGSLNNGRITKRLEEGQPLYAWWMYEVEGVWQTQDEIDNNASISGAIPGHLRYRDQNGDGIIDDKDKKFFGSYLPTYNFGLNLGVNYKNFDLIVEGYGAGGNKIYNGIKGTRIDGGENIAADVFNNRWTGAGSTNAHPGANRDAEASNYYLEDGDYFRINNITLGYTFSKMDYVSKVRIYATAQNPFIFTKYSGFTPEIIGSAGGNGGVDLSAYPNNKTFLFGVNIEL